MKIKRVYEDIYSLKVTDLTYFGNTEGKVVQKAKKGLLKELERLEKRKNEFKEALNQLEHIDAKH